MHFDALGASLCRISPGFLFGTSFALVLGCLTGWYKPVEQLFDPLIDAVRPIPRLAYIPIVILWFGIEEFSRVLLISITCFMVCVVNVVAGMRNVTQVYVDAASTMGISRFHISHSTAIPAATPFIFTGFRIALAAAWTTLVAAELIAAPSGLGVLLQEGRRYFLTDQVIVMPARPGSMRTGTAETAFAGEQFPNTRGLRRMLQPYHVLGSNPQDVRCEVGCIDGTENRLPPPTSRSASGEGNDTPKFLALRTCRPQRLAGGKPGHVAYRSSTIATSCPVH